MSTAVLITPLQLEKEPLLFKEAIPAGALDYAPDITQAGPLPVRGRADLLLEHRGHREQVADIRLRADWHGDFEILCARCVEPVPTPLGGDFDLIFRPHSADADPGERAITPMRPKSAIMKRAVFRLKMSCASRCFLPCPAVRSASPTAKDFARAAART